MDQAKRRLEVATTDEERQFAQEELDAISGLLSKMAKVNAKVTKESGGRRRRKRTATPREKELLAVVQDLISVMSDLADVSDAESLEDYARDIGQAIARTNAITWGWS